MTKKVPRYSVMRGYYYVWLALIGIMILTASFGRRYFFLGSIFVLELLVLVIYTFAVISMLRNLDRSDSDLKYSFDRSGISVNGNLKYRWENISRVSFNESVEEYGVNMSFPSSSGLVRPRVPVRYDKPVEVTRSFKFGTLELYLHSKMEPVAAIKCPKSVHRARRLLKNMEKYSSAVNPGIEFNMNQEPNGEGKAAKNPLD